MVKNANTLTRRSFQIVGVVLGFLSMAQVGLHESPAVDDGIAQHSACILRDGAAADISQPIGATTLLNIPNYLTQLRGQQWNKPVVTIRLAEGDTQRTTEETMHLLEQATHLWNEEIGGMVQLRWTDTADADITVRFVPAAQLPFQAVGRTDTRYRRISRSLLHADVTLSQGMNSKRLEQVAAHEFGHALGIPGHSPSTDDLMYPITHTPARITDRDRNTMCLNYQATPARYPIAETGEAAPTTLPAPLPTAVTVDAR